MWKVSHEKVGRESWERRSNIWTVGTWGISMGVGSRAGGRNACFLSCSLLHTLTLFVVCLW